MAYPTNTQPRQLPQSRALEEKAKSLAGLNGTPERVAITRGDVAQLGQIKLLSAKVAATPTPEQHNALVEDVRALAAVLNAMGASFTGL